MQDYCALPSILLELVRIPDLVSLPANFLSVLRGSPLECHSERAPGIGELKRKVHMHEKIPPRSENGLIASAYGSIQVFEVVLIQQVIDPGADPDLL